jgi:hypothetical protein
MTATPRALINHILCKFGVQLRRVYPERQAIIEAKRYFKDKPLVACEIGVFQGEHALETLRHLNISKFYLIDPYTKASNSDSGSAEFLRQAMLNAQRLLKPYEEKLVWLEKFSNEAVADIGEELDFVYIDGNHKSPFVDNDIKNYYRLVKEGGIIAGHDYTWIGFPDVVKAVHDFIKRENKELMFGREDDWLVIK